MPACIVMLMADGGVAGAVCEDPGVRMAWPRREGAASQRWVHSAALLASLLSPLLFVLNNTKTTPGAIIAIYREYFPQHRHFT